MNRDGREDLARRDEIVRVARSWIGTPYQHQASLKGVGADCLGLLRGVWRETVGEEPEDVPAYSPAWAELGAPDQLLGGAFRHLLPLPMDAEIRPGTVLLFRWRAHLPAKHCGIATGPDTFVHAHDGASVAEVVLVPLWRRKLAGLFDFPARRD
jgi:NlpC/P60 family putative phage cell wall peptidase